MADNGWIKVYRKIMDWRWYKDSCTLHIFLHLLLKASTVDGEYMRWQIKRGQLMTSLSEIAEQTGVSRQRVRTALQRLKQTGEISTHPATQQGTLVTVCNYDSYNTPKKAANTPSNTPPTHLQHTSNTPRDKEYKNTKNIFLETRAREDKRQDDEDDGKFLERFFRKENKAYMETLLMSFGLKPEETPALRSMAKEIVTEWKLTDTRHAGYTDWARHLVNTMRIKRKEKQEKSAGKNAEKQNRQPPEQADYDYSGGFGSKDV